jgi:ABC-2 type transport system ATP-binding protein
MISITELKKQFGDTIACDIPSLTISDGDIVGLVGNNGAGKTTLFRLLLDLLKPDSGHVMLDDINPAESETWKETTGAYIDEGFLIDYLTPEEYFRFLARITGVEDMEDRVNRYKRLLSDELIKQKKLIRNLSAGNKQKVGIVAALVTEPKLVILDEPFNFLDPSSQNILKHILSDYHQRTGATMIISSHNLQYTIDISTRLIVLEQGRVVMDGVNRGDLERYFNVE